MDPGFRRGDGEGGGGGRQGWGDEEGWSGGEGREQASVVIAVPVLARIANLR